MKDRLNEPLDARNLYLVGSSKNMSGGLLTSSRAMARRLH